MHVHENYFDGPIAAPYDAGSSEMFEPAVVESAVSFLADLAGDGKALELAIGTGRIALPLHQREVPVSGNRPLTGDGRPIEAEAGRAAHRRRDRRFHVNHRRRAIQTGLPGVQHHRERDESG
jgi:hypothetical protein